MKWTHTTGLLATFALIAAGGVWAGCSSNDNTTDGGTDGGGNDVNQQDTGKTDSGGNDSGGNDSGGGDAGLAVDASALDCNYYCDSIMAVCNQSATQQYLDKATCVAMCGAIPNDAGAGATAGDSLACRMYHLSVAATTPSNAATHCPHAGPFGFGACGDLCNDFCESFYASTSPCKATNSYPSADVCRTYCAGAGGSDAGAGAPGTAASTPAMACREYHFENAWKTGGSGGGHCAHAGEDGGGVCP